MWGFGFIFKRFFTVSSKDGKSKPFIVGRASTYPDYTEPKAKEMLAAVGIVIPRSALCETLLATIYGHLCGTSAAACSGFASLISFDAKVDMIEAALKEGQPIYRKHPEARDEIRKILAKFRKIMKVRNNIAHGELRVISLAYNDGSLV